LLYLPPVDFLVHELKFRGNLTAARLLGQLLGEALLCRSGPLPEAVVPVPLHRSRLRERGFNQAIELARPVSRRLEIPLLVDHVERIHPSPPQSKLDLKARRGNVRGAFACRGGMDVQRVAILDDVITTGSTADAMARVLRRAGAVQIEVWAACC
jgi:ComF family protein